MADADRVVGARAQAVDLVAHVDGVEVGARCGGVACDLFRRHVQHRQGSNRVSEFEIQARNGAPVITRDLLCKSGGFNDRIQPGKISVQNRNCVV